jgi:hypothetical protein
MKSSRVFSLLAPFLALLALCLAGCIPSVNPFYTEADLRAEPALAGRWRMEQNGGWEDWVFAPGDTTGYALTITTHEGKTGRFSAHLFELNGQRFFDLVATDADFVPSQYDLVKFSLIPGHLLVRMDWAGDHFRLALFDFDWLAKHLEANSDALAHHRETDRKEILLTADTAALQRFVLAHLGEGELFNKFDEVWRREAEAVPPPAPAP